MIIALRTDNPEATVCILQSDGSVAAKHVWHAHRTLARDLLRVVHDQLATARKDWDDITGLIVFAGPGSFTGLRIGAAVANTIAHEKQVPIVSVTGDSWLEDGIDRLKAGEDDKVILPTYGAEPHITQPKK